MRNRPWLPQFDLPLLFEIVAGAALAIALCVELGPLRAGILVVVAGVPLFIAYARSKWVQHKFTMVEILAILALAALGAAVLMPMAQVDISARFTPTCRGHLRAIGLALRMYHDKHGCYPPAVVNDGMGNPMHGWQIFLQPMMDEVNLFERYDFNQPWDGPNNRPMAAVIANHMTCWGMTTSGRTSYYLVTGRGRWADAHAPRLQEITDGPEQTILVVEANRVAAFWTQPRPLTVDEFLEQSRSGQLATHYYRRHEWAPLREGRHVLMADGEMRVLRADLDERTWRALLTPAGGERIDLDRVVIPQELPILRMLLLTAGYVLIVSWRRWGPRRFRTSRPAVQ